jgi:hypothetical protein
MFQAGPLTVARFGKDIIYQTNWDPADFERVQKELAGRLESIVQEIDALVGEVAAKVAKLPALKLLHRAWWTAAAQHIGIETEAEIGPDEAIAMRMIDYIQSVIASVPPAAEQADELEDSDWEELVELVGKLFHKVNGDYHISSTLRRKLDGQDYDKETEEFRYRAQIYWTNVRGQRHYAHQVVALRELLGGQDQLIQKALGIGATALVDELEKVWHALIFGLGEAFQELEAVRQATLEGLGMDLELSSDDPGDIIRATMDKQGVNERAQRAAAKAFRYDLFDLQKVTNLPVNVLEALSWEQGTEQDFFAPGPMRGWPLRIWPTFRRPFIKLNGRYYCFDVHSLFDHIYRTIEKIVFDQGEGAKQAWVAQRKETTEALPAEHLSRLLPGATDYGQIYYPLGSGNWAELDRLVGYDDHLFVVEVKGGSFTYTSPADDFAAHVASLKTLLDSPAKQAKRFLKYVESAAEVPIFDKNHKEVGRIRAGDYRNITICAISTDPFTEFAAQAQHLGKLGLTELDRPIWSISIDDFRVFADVFETPIEFLHFVEQRQLAFRSELLQLDDELDHVGLYLAHNNYSQHARKLVGENDIRFGVFGYRSELDKFYYRKLGDPSAASPLSQEMPLRMREMISFLSRSTKLGRVRLGCALLDLDGDARATMFSAIEAQVARMRTGQKPQAYSSFGEVRITTLPWAPPAFPQEHDKALRLARASIAANGEPDRLLIEPKYFNCNELIDIDWQQVSNVLFDEGEQARLRHEGAQLRAKRVIAAKGRVGRNDQCPCGSGKKYKKCCLH